MACEPLDYEVHREDNWLGTAVAFGDAGLRYEIKLAGLTRDEADKVMNFIATLMLIRSGNVMSPSEWSKITDLDNVPTTRDRDIEADDS